MAQDALEKYLNSIEGNAPLSTEQPSTTTNSSYSDYYNSLEETTQREEGPTYSDAIMTDYVNKIQKNPQALTLGKVYTLDELEKDPEFQMRSERFMESIEDDEDIFEYLRDTDFSLSSAILRAGQVKGWSEEAKADYNYLRNTFDNAEIGSTRQYLQLAGDMTVDLIADPINWLSAAFFIPSGGTSSLVGLTAKEIVKKGFKSATTKKFAKIGAVEGAVWNGPHDYFLQSAETELGMREEIDWSQVGITSALGAGLGGVFGGSIGAITSISPALTKKLFKYSNEDDTIKGGMNVSRAGEEEGVGIDKATDVINDKAQKPKKAKDNKRLKLRMQALSNTFGKYTSQFVEIAENSPAMQMLLGRFRYDWSRTFTEGAKELEARSYGLELSERMHGYLFEMRDAIQPLSRGSFWFKNTLRQDQNDNLIILLRQTRKEFEANVASGKAAKNAGEEVVEAATRIRKTLNNIFEEGVETGLMTRDQFIDHYFPRHFQHSKIIADKSRFVNIIKNSKHSEIRNEYAQSDKIKIVTETGKEVEGIKFDSNYIDADSFKDAQGKGRNFLTEAGGDENLARQLKAEAIVEDMLEKRYNPFQFGTKDNAGGGHQFLQHRVFNDIDDNLLTDFLENNVEEVIEQYITSASRAITRTKHFGKTKADFEKRWLIPITKQLRDSGVSGDETTKVVDKLRLMHQRVTGLDTDQLRFKGKFAKHSMDIIKLSQQMAHLPFATISSLTEPLILLSRVDSTSGKFAASKEVGKALVKGIKKDWDKLINYSKRVSGVEVKGRAEMGDEYWHEAYKVGLAMEQAVMDRIEGLYGEALEGSIVKKLQNAFFKANLLSSWTGAVQLASFTTGKRLIRENTEQLITGKTLLGNKLSKSKRDYLTKQLHELGINEKDAKKWYTNSLDKNGVFDQGRAQGTATDLDFVYKKFDKEGNKVLKTKAKNQIAFYKNQYQSGANRFTREIILNPSTAEANRPLWFSHPAGQILAQFAGYPTVFNNTVLKRWINEGLIQNKRQTSAKIAGTALAMTAIATFTNAVRSGGRSLEEDDGIIITEAIQRWGGLGPADYAYRFYQNAKTGSGQAAALLKTPTGPIVSDVVDAAIYRKGLVQTLGTNIPFFSALPQDIRKSIKKSGRNIDKVLWDGMFADPKKEKERKIKSITYTYAKGGVVSIPNASTEPDEKKVRGMPFTYAELGGVLAQDVEDRKGYVLGGLINRIAKFGTPSTRKSLMSLTEEVGENDLIRHLTKEIRKAEPIFEAPATTSLYKKAEADEFAKNVDEEAVRYVNSDKISDLEEELRYSTEIGIKATTKPKASGGKKVKHKGRLRLVRPLNLTDFNKSEYSGSNIFSGSGFVERLAARSSFRLELMQNSPLPAEDSRRLIKELIDNYTDTKRLIETSFDLPKEVLQPLLDIKQSTKVRETLTNLGYDSIRYNNSEYILFDNNQFRVTKKLFLKYKGFSGLGKKVDFNRSPLGLYSKSFVALENLPEKLFQGKNKGGTIGQMDKLGFAEGGRVDYADGEEVEKEDDGINLFGKDGLIFDHTNPLDYLMAIPGLGLLGVGAKAASKFKVVDKIRMVSRQKKLPTTQYHGGYTSVEKGMANKRGIYTTPDYEIARTFAQPEFRTFKDRGAPGLYKLDLSKVKNIELTDKPTKGLRKTIDAELEKLTKKGTRQDSLDKEFGLKGIFSSRNLPEKDERLYDGLKWLFGKDKDIRGGAPTYKMKETLDFLRKEGVEILTDSKTLKGKGGSLEYFLIKDFPKKKLSQKEIEKLEKLLRKKLGYAEGGEVLSNEQTEFIQLALEVNREGFAEGGEAKKEEEDSLKLFGKDGLIFDHTNPLSYAMFISGVGLVGWGAKLGGGAVKSARAFKNFPKEVYHGGEKFDKMKFGKLDKKVYTEGLHKPEFADEISSVYTSADPKYAAGYAERFRSLKTKDKGILDHMKIDDPKVAALRKKEVQAQIDKYGFPGFMKIDTSKVKRADVHFWDKPSKKIKKDISKRIEAESARRKIDSTINPLDSNVRIGELRRLTGYTKTSVGEPTYLPDLTLFQRTVLRENGIKLVTKSTHVDNLKLQQVAKKTGRPEPSEYILIDDFPVTPLNFDEKTKVIDAYTELLENFLK